MISERYYSRSSDVDPHLAMDKSNIRLDSLASMPTIYVKRSSQPVFVS